MYIRAKGLSCVSGQMGIFVYQGKGVELCVRAKGLSYVLRQIG